MAPLSAAARLVVSTAAIVVLAAVALAAPNGFTELPAGPRLTEPRPLVLLTVEPADPHGRRVLPTRTVAPDPREYYIDLTICPQYNLDLDNVDSMPEALPFLLLSPWLVQNDEENPLARGLIEAELLNTDEGRLERRLLHLGLYMGANMGASDNATNGMLLMLKRERVGLRDPWVGVGARFLRERFSGFVGVAHTSGDEIAIDISSRTVTSYDSVANVENMILSAQRSRLSGIAVTDNDSIGGALFAQRVAERLKRQGQLRKDFMVIVGEDVTTREGHIYALFVYEHVLQGMTAKQTVGEIHRQGGLAILADPAGGNGVRLARKYAFDGYVIRPGMGRIYRALQLGNDPKLFAKPMFYTLSPSFKDTFGAVYTLVDTPDHTPEGVKQAIKEGRAYASGNAYYPYVAVLGIIPITKYEGFLNRYFEARGEVEHFLEKLLGADNVRLWVSWTPTVRRLMNLQILSTIGSVSIGDSPLRKPPEVDGISVSYGPVYLEYRRGAEEEEVFFTLASRF